MFFIKNTKVLHKQFRKATLFFFFKQNMFFVSCRQGKLNISNVVFTKRGFHRLRTLGKHVLVFCVLKQYRSRKKIEKTWISVFLHFCEFRVFSSRRLRMEGCTFFWAWFLTFSKKWIFAYPFDYNEIILWKAVFFHVFFI